MPIFEYTCAACGCSFEKLQKNSEEQFPACPSCGSTDVGKKLSAFSSAGAAASASCFSGG